MWKRHIDQLIGCSVDNRDSVDTKTKIAPQPTMSSQTPVVFPALHKTQQENVHLPDHRFQDFSSKSAPVPQDTPTQSTLVKKSPVTKAEPAVVERRYSVRENKQMLKYLKDFTSK